MLINADRSRLVIVHGAQLPWVSSPESGVERRMLERIGDEVALATSIVRYDLDTHFSGHVHELGEEFYVLEGTFADEHGSYPAGTYVRNPPGSSHAPFSIEGCTLLVKLRQMADDETDIVRNFAHNREWLGDVTQGIQRSVVYENARLSVELVRIEAGCELKPRNHSDGEELFVIQGSIQWRGESPTILDRWGWLRNPGKNHGVLIAQVDSLLWIKRGHL